MQVQTFNKFYPDHIFLYERMLHLLHPLEQNYPQLTSWYREVFLPGLVDGERGYVLAVSGGELAGCALLKNTQDEKKISTIFVDPRFRRQGLGRKLFTEAMKALGNTAQLSVSEEVLPQLNPLLAEFDFHFLEKKENVYKNGKSELYFSNFAKTKTRHTKKISTSNVKQKGARA